MQWSGCSNGTGFFIHTHEERPRTTHDCPIAFIFHCTDKAMVAHSFKWVGMWTPHVRPIASLFHPQYAPFSNRLRLPTRLSGLPVFHSLLVGIHNFCSATPVENACCCQEFSLPAQAVLSLYWWCLSEASCYADESRGGQACIVMDKKIRACKHMWW